MRILKILVLSLFCGVAFAQTPQELKSYLPKIAGWTISDEVEVFNPQNLFERINGAAPLFIENNFREMTSLFYEKGDNYITLQIYRHATPIDAFGMYVSERSEDLPFYPIGGEAQGDNLGLYFFVGNVYVKMSGTDESDESGLIMRKIAKDLADKIEPNATYPTMFSKFPEKEKVKYSEFYTTSNYIGHDFLKGVYSCDYGSEGNIYQVFIIDSKTKEDAHNTLMQYVKFTKQSADFSEGKLILKDKYNGNVSCFWKGQYIIGIFNETGQDVHEDALFEEITRQLTVEN